MEMKILKKLKKWIAGFTALSMLLAFVPQVTFAASPSLDEDVESAIVRAGPIDTTPPVISGVTNGSYYNTDATITYTDNTDLNPSVLLNGNPIPSPRLVSAEGNYTLNACDASSNCIPVIHFTIDKTLPGITLIGTNPYETQLGDPYNDPGVIVTETSPYSLINDANLVNTSAVGTFTVTYTATDVATNSSVKTRTVMVVDTVGPTVDAGIDEIRNAAFEHEGTATDISGVVSTEWEKGSGPGTVTFSYPPLANDLKPTISADIDGIYVISLTVSDTLGNESNDTFTLTWDTNGPNVDAGPDRATNKEITLTGTAIDIVSGVANVKWTTDSAHVMLGTPNALSTTVIADEDGTYTLTLTAIDRAGKTSSSEMTLVWNTDIPEPPSWGDPAIVTGDGFIDLHWLNPEDVDGDFNGVNIYRSTNPSDSWQLIYSADKDSTSYSDENVINGTTYYYLLKSTDLAGNESDPTDQRFATPIASTSGPIVLTPLVASSEVYYPTGGPENPDILGDQNQGGEVKSGEADQNNSDSEDDNNRTALPAVGIALLIILALVGLYLLYLQNPKWFSWLLFWKKKK